MIPNMVTIPILNNLLLLVLKLLGIALSNKLEIIYPIVKERIVKRMAIIIEKLSLNSFIVSGIKSTKETVSITPMANDMELQIIKFLLFVLKKTNKKPIKVDSPAKEHKIKAISSPN